MASDARPACTLSYRSRVGKTSVSKLISRCYNWLQAQTHTGHGKLSPANHKSSKTAPCKALQSHRCIESGCISSGPQQEGSPPRRTKLHLRDVEENFAFQTLTISNSLFVTFKVDSQGRSGSLSQGHSQGGLSGSLLVTLGHSQGVGALKVTLGQAFRLNSDCVWVCVCMLVRAVCDCERAVLQRGPASNQAPLRRCSATSLPWP